MPHRFHHAVTMTSSVQVVRDGAVTVVTIDRPDRRNAVDPPTAEALLDAFTSFDVDDSSSVAVLTGSGTTFCAGADLKALAGGARHRVATDGPGPMGPTRLELSKPVIAAVEGYAVAGGLELAIWCDLRVAAEGSVFGVFCRRFGVPLIDGGTVRLPRMIGQGRALDLILTGREVGAEEALAIGLVDRVVPDGTALDHATALGHQLAALPQACLRNDRRSAMDQWGRTLADALVVETELGLDSLADPDAASGAAGFTAGAGRGGSAVDPTRS
jgi:enoyl-CoA hydratase